MKRSLRSWLWRVPIDQEVEEELAFHGEMRRREGKPVDPAAVERVRQACVEIARKRDREMWLTTWLEERRTDIRFVLRQLRRAPGFTAVAVLTLALGIGANSAIFALADATFLRALPFTHPADRLVMVWESRGPGTFIMATPLDFRDWSDQNRTLAAMAAMMPSTATIVGADATPEQVPAQSVTAGFFDVLGVTPLLGRGLGGLDARPDAQEVVVSEGFWRSRLGADRDVIGRTLVIDGGGFTIVGVLPANFQLVPPSVNAASTEMPQLWVLNEAPNDNRPGMRFPHMLAVVGRLKPGVRLDGAQADLSAIASRLAEQYPESNKGHGVTVHVPARGAGRTRSAADVAAPAGRRRLRVADVLRQCREPAAHPGGRPYP